MRVFTLRKTVLMASAAILALAIAGQATAQTASTGTTAAKSEDVVVVVTAQKKAENLEVVPQSVSVVDAQQMAQYHVTQLTDVGAYVPGLQVDSTGTPGQTLLTIRGISPLGVNATVGTYLDDTPIGSTGFHNRGYAYALDILPYDIQRVEVLEGPQGTLYGANALGGLVKYVTTSPNLRKTEIDVGADVFGIAGGGNMGTGYRGMINAPLIADKLGMTASWSVENSPGYIDNAISGAKDQNSAKQEGGRLALLWQPVDELKVRFGAFYSRTRADGNASIALDPATMKPLYGWQTDNNYTPNLFDNRLELYSLDVNWDLGWAKLVSATSYSQQATSTIADNSITYASLLDAFFGAPNARTSFPLELRSKKVTQELRLSSPSTDKLEWQIGGYYDDEKGTNVQSLRVTNPDGSILTGVDPLFEGSLPSTYRETAVFGNLDYHFTDRFDVAGGLRWAKNDQTYSQILAPGPLVGAGSNDAATPSSESVWTYSFSPRFKITSNSMVYGRIATGYQAGGPNLAFPGVPPTVQSSTLTNYEIGWKNTLPAIHAVINAAIYDIQWDKINLLVTTNGGIGYNANGGRARSRGFQLDGAIRPMTGLQLAGTFNYTDAVFTELSPEVSIVRVGDKIPYMPKVSGSLRADYTHALSGDWQGHLGAGLRLVGDRYDTSVAHISDLLVKGYNALDFNADVNNGRYTIRFYAKNVTNTRALVTVNPVPDGLTNANLQNEGVILQPRTLGIAVDAKF